MHSAAPCSATKSPKSRLAPRFTFYDALYVALATALDVPLLTGDSRLAAAPGLPCEIKLVR